MKVHLASKHSLELLIGVWSMVGNASEIDLRLLRHQVNGRKYLQIRCHRPSGVRLEDVTGAPSVKSVIFGTLSEASCSVKYPRSQLHGNASI